MAESGADLLPLGRTAPRDRSAMLHSVPVCFEIAGTVPGSPGRIVGERHADTRESRRHRWGNDGSGAALPPRRGGVVRHPARGEGGAHLGLDVACGGPVPELHRRLQHGEDPRLRGQALPQARGEDRAVRELARMRRHPVRDEAGGGGVVPSRRKRRQAHRLPMRDHRPGEDQADQSVRERRRRARGRMDDRRRPRGSRRML